MTLINTLVFSSSACRTLISWTVIQVESGQSFKELFVKVAAGAYPRLPVDEELSLSRLDRVFVGQSKDSLSLIDESLRVEDVCRMFGHHVKFSVIKQETQNASCSQPTIDLIADVMSRLELKGKKFEVQTGCSELALESFWEILQQIEPALSSDDTTREKIKDKSSELQAFLKHCCEVRHFSFCVKMCGKDGCDICKPVRMDVGKLSNLYFLPDPILGSDNHYLPFTNAFSTTPMSEMFQPSLRVKGLAKPLSFSPSVQHALNSGITVQCEECDKWRVVFSKKKLTSNQRSTLQSVLEDVSYSYGASLEDIQFPITLSSHSIVVRDHRCGDTIERLYYSAEYEDICI